MGTRATVKFFETGSKGSRPKLLLSVYHQYDGYTDGVGKALVEFISGLRLVNGFGSRDSAVANGAGCLAAQYLAKFKDGVGNVYCTTADDEQDYDYEVRVPFNGKTDAITVRYRQFDREWSKWQPVGQWLEQWS